MQRISYMTAILRAFALLFMAAFAQAAQTQALLTGQEGSVDLWPHVQVLPDPTRAIGVEQAIAVRERFGEPQGAYATLGMDKEVVWLRVPIAISAGGAGTWILDFDYALLQRVDVYQVSGGKVVRQVALGDTLPFATRPLRGRSHAVPLDFTAGSSELLVRVDTRGAKILPVSLARLPDFHARARSEERRVGKECRSRWSPYH